MDKEKVDKASDEIVNKTYTDYKQRELTEKDEKTGDVLGKHLINMYSNGISQVIKIRDVKKLHQDAENDPIIKNFLEATTLELPLVKKKC